MKHNRQTIVKEKMPKDTAVAVAVAADNEDDNDDDYI